MTREEAKIILDGFKSNPLFNEQHKQALDMAISALSDYDTMQKISLDLAFENDELMNELDSIKNVLAEIKGEIESLTITEGGNDYTRKMAELYSLKLMVLNIIDKHIGKVGE